MSGFWLASYIVLWLVVIGLGGLLFGTLQQLGLLQRQLRAQGNGEAVEGQGLSEIPEITVEGDGPSIGSQLPALIVNSINGHGAVSLGAQQHEGGTLLVSMSASCESCQLFVDPLNALADNGDFTGQVVVMMRDDLPSCQAFLKVFPLHVPVVGEAKPILMELGIHGSPFSLVYDSENVLVRKGITKGSDDLLAILGRDSAPVAAYDHIFPPPASPLSA